MRTAVRYAPEKTRAAVLKMVRDLVEFVDAKKTLTSVQDFLLTTEAIITGHPTMTLEEIRLTFQDMMTGKHGKFYERLKTAEVLEACCRHEASRADILERINRGEITRGLREGQQVKFAGPETLAEVIRRRHPLWGDKAKAARLRKSEQDAIGLPHEEDSQETDRHSSESGQPEDDHGGAI